MSDEVKCNHVTLSLLGGPIHNSGKDYVCHACGIQFRAEPLVIGVHYGTPPAVCGPKREERT